LLAQGDSRRLAGGVELEMRTIAGVNYSVRAWNDLEQTRRLHVNIPLDSDGGHYLTAVPGLPLLTKTQLASLRYRFTTNGWKTSGEAVARLVEHTPDGLIVDFEDLAVSQVVGRLEGEFYFARDGRRGARRKTGRLGGYVFAIPDRQELLNLATVQGTAARA
jgi:hypothetical protein